MTMRSENALTMCLDETTKTIGQLAFYIDLFHIFLQLQPMM